MTVGHPTVSAQPSTEAQQSCRMPPAQGPAAEDPRQVTVVLRNIACRYTQDDVKGLLDEYGLRGKFSLLYVPRIESRNSNFGYAFVRFRNSAYAAECADRLSGKVFGQSRTTKLCQVEIAKTQESIEAILGRRRRKQNGVKPEVLLCDDPLPGLAAPAHAADAISSKHDMPLCAPSAPGSSPGAVDMLVGGFGLPPCVPALLASATPPASPARATGCFTPPPGLADESVGRPFAAQRALAQPAAGLQLGPWPAMRTSFATPVVVPPLLDEKKQGVDSLLVEAVAKLLGEALARVDGLSGAPMSYSTEPRYVQVASA
eukprot:CAMPEP_0170238382 /NCGR_PEP_ID=MMETSP0116_2-20130129/18945_1 /TAXON_ID=400756 /ORGANISM="Durinskia baltica, Strain CSIRO CS-38" /LENGTH=315 /DNA_ID=CAMNT_0010489193 /DNA_START=37 /DNA_END=984 /DNA_ORIENTATION=-